MPAAIFLASLDFEQKSLACEGSAASTGYGILMYDISNSDSPVFFDSTGTPGSAQSVFVSGRYAYVADGANGLQIIDLDAVLALFQYIIGNAEMPDFAYDAAIREGFAYVAIGDDGLRLFDISDPASPILRYPRLSHG